MERKVCVTILTFKMNSFNTFTRGVLWKKMLLKISKISQENNCVEVSFFNNRPLSNLGDFYEHVF